MLAASLDRRLGEFHLTAELKVEVGQTLVLVGETGSGKTTVLRLLAGLLRPDSGHISLGGAVWFDALTDTDLPTWRRAVGWVPQDYALFPHLSVAENVAFGLRSAGLRAPEARERCGRTLVRFGVAELASRRPGELSGGQQQRVALARALALEPPLLLLDEPLAALDVQTRRSVRAELRSILQSLPCATVFVTHSPMEALVLGDRIAVMENGTLTQEGSREELLHHPRSAYVAELLGLNLFRGRVVGRESAGMARIDAGGASITAADPGTDDEVFLAVDPREVTIHIVPPEGSAQNLLRGPIEEIVPEPPRGERLRVIVESRPPIVAEVTARAVAALSLRPGLEVFAAFKATGVRTYR
jgi:molybdate transport system ATP-binding protein